MKETSANYTVRVEDETRTRSTVLPVQGDTPWIEVSARSVEALELPTEMGGEPISHFLYRSDTGEAILGDECVQDVFGPNVEEARVLIAPEMKPARPA